MSSLSDDLRFGLRFFRRNPGFAAAVSGTLAAGVAISTLIFSVVNALLYAKYDVYRDPGRLVYILEESRETGATGGTSARTIGDWQDRARSFECLGGVEPGSAVVIGAGEPRSVMSGRVTEGLLSVLDARPAVGRVFERAEYEAPGTVALLSHSAWIEQFGSSPDVVGRALEIDGRAATVVGVLEPRFTLAPFLGGRSPAVYLPARTDPAGDRAARRMIAIGRLGRDATVAQAQSELGTIFAAIAAGDRSARGWAPLLVRPRSPKGDAQFLVVLSVGVALVLMIVCANVANLLLVRSAGRAREVATRLAVGAGRLRIGRQFLTESAMLGIAGGAAGLFLAWAGCRTVQWWISGTSIAHLDLHVDGRVLLFSIVVALLMSLGVGALPSMRLARLPVAEALRNEASLWGRMSAGRLRRLLVAAEVALSVVLLVSGGLVLQGIVNLRQNDPGFRPDGLLTLRVTMSDEKYSETSARTRFVEEALERLGSRPSFESAAVTTLMPAIGGEPPVAGFEIAGGTADRSAMPSAGLMSVSPGYFSTMGIPMLRGRSLEQSDRETSLPVAVVSDGLARRWMAGKDPVGARIEIDGTWRTVVGVAGDVRNFHLNVAARPTVYVPYAQRPMPSIWFAIRTGPGQESRLVGPARTEVKSVDARQPVAGGESAQTLIRQSMGGFDMTGLLVATLAGLAAGLAALGIYGVVSFSVARRSRELGIRRALGADRRQLMRLVIGDGVRMAAWGGIPGLLLALAAGRMLASKLHRVNPFDPVLLAGTAIAVSALVLLASWGPARRAAAVDPVTATRTE